MPTTSLPRRAAAIAAGLTAALALVPAQGTASPPRDPISEQITTAEKNLEIVVERYNEVREELRATAARAETLTRQMVPLERSMQVHAGRLGTIAATAYRTNGNQALVAMFAAASSHNLVDPLLVLERLSKEQASIIAELSGSRERLASARRTVQTLIARQRVQERQLSARKGQIEYEIGRLTRLRETTRRPNIARPPVAERPPAMPRGAAAAVVTFAYAQLGKSYRWGGEGPDGYDCSGLTMAAWAAAGVRLPHNAAWQWRTVTPISRAALRPGDLIFYYSDIHHVAVYLGAGRMIHAPRPGLWIRVEQVDFQPVYGYGRPG